jgi:YidC/Oxa1 family membrane protein insertase
MLKTLFFNPFYNALVALIGIMPAQDIGLAIITLTVLVKVIIFPIYRQSIQTNLKLKEISPEIEALKKKYADDKVVQSQKIMELYRQNQINPLSGFIVILIQIPIFITLYYVFRSNLSSHLDSLYSFIHFPTHANANFLGLFDLNGAKNYLFAVLTALTQFIQTKLTLPAPTGPKKAIGEGTFSEDLSRSMNLQMTYLMPIVIGFIAVSLPAAVSLYWITSNSIHIVMEVLWRRKTKMETTKKVSA